MKLDPIPTQSKPLPLIEEWLSAFAPSTSREYAKDLDRCAKLLHIRSEGFLLATLRGSTKQEAERLAVQLRMACKHQGMSPATINRRLCTLRSLCGYLHRVGTINWRLEAKLEKIQPRRDMRGPTLGEVRAVWAHLVLAGPGRRQQRHRACFRLLWDLALRTHEICELRGEDFDREQGCLWARGKGQAGKHCLSLPPETMRELEAWVDHYHPASPTVPKDALLFPAYTDAMKVWDTKGMRRLVAKWGGLVRRHWSPHRVRHGSITAALQSGAMIQDVRLWARHQDANTTLAYFDADQDTAGSVARVAASLLGQGEGGEE